MKSILTTAITGLLFCLVLSSCAINRTIPKRHLDKSIVPAEFDPQKHVLLVVKMPYDRKGKLNRQMNELLVKYYPAKFEIVEMEDIRSANPKYADTSVYKYAVVNSLSRVSHTTTTTFTKSGGGIGSVSPSATTTYISYRFFDRTNNAQYESSYPSAWLKTSVQAFANTVKKAKNLQ